MNATTTARAGAHPMPPKEQRRIRIDGVNLLVGSVGPDEIALRALT
jgi:hypothetical protein